MLRERQWELVKWGCAPVRPPALVTWGTGMAREKRGAGQGSGCRSLQAVAKKGFIPRKGAPRSKRNSEKEKLLLGLRVERRRDESEGGV